MQTSNNYDELSKIIGVAGPSFMAYFNMGHTEYEEQIISWVDQVYSPFDDFLESLIGLKTKDFLVFYDTLDRLINLNFQAHTTNPELLRDNWRTYTDKAFDHDSIPFFLKKTIDEKMELHTLFTSDYGMKDRFMPLELINEGLEENKVRAILSLLSITRRDRSFLYYTEVNPGNPLFDKPILKLKNDMYQVFEPVLVIKAIKEFLFKTISSESNLIPNLTKQRGKVLEQNIVMLFEKLFAGEAEIYQSYSVEQGFEQDILVIWKEYAFIIEAKAYSLREPFRDPVKAFKRIKDDFDSSIGHGYHQALRVERKFAEGENFKIYGHKGEVLREINSNDFKEWFSIIVNRNSFGLVQNDLSYLLEIKDEHMFPWAVKYDDLEIFILTLMAQGRNPKKFVEYLLFREQIHGKIQASDELEICGGFLDGRFKVQRLKYIDRLETSPYLGSVFDNQYAKGMGFENERYLDKKKDKGTKFW